MWTARLPQAWLCMQACFPRRGEGWGMDAGLLQQEQDTAARQAAGCQFHTPGMLSPRRLDSAATMARLTSHHDDESGRAHTPTCPSMHRYLM